MESLIDFGPMPLANAYRQPDDLSPEAVYPLHAYTCRNCGLVQVDHTVPPAAMFSDYAFFSSYSAPWVSHCRRYVQRVTGRFALDAVSQVIEIASNDGCLLAQFDGPQILGIDPAINVAKQAAADGIPTVCDYFNARVARTLPPADLLIANNVLGHVPDLNDFLAGAWTVLAKEGVFTIEVPWLYHLLTGCQYDTIYHEHFSYFAVQTLVELLRQHGLRVFDAEALEVHGGSIRLYACHEHAAHRNTTNVKFLIDKETCFGIGRIGSPLYTQFAQRVTHNTDQLLRWFDWVPSVGGVGAPAKGNTLLNAAGITADQLPYTTDTNPHKQGLVLPGSCIPIYPPAHIDAEQPEYLFVLAWNWVDAIRSNWPDAKFVTPIPYLKVDQ